jgi:putative proteasome-type protease
MTYCLGIKLKDGLVGIADTRITSGTETTMAKKLFTYEDGKNSLFLMTSGLRSVRDKALTYFKEVLEAKEEPMDKLYKVVNLFSKQIKIVAKEDKVSLHDAGLNFNIHTLIGGQMEGDTDVKLYLIYPEGNWIEIGGATPFYIIGNSGYGKPILNRSITKEVGIPFALKTGLLSFDSTRVCANDVGYPIDVFVYETGSFKIKQHRFNEKDLRHLSDQWAKVLNNGIAEMSEDFADVFVEKKKKVVAKKKVVKNK